MHLTIDSTNNQKSLLKLDDEKFVKKYASPREQDLLAFLNQTLTKKNLPPASINQITVNPGPGHFTSLRCGLALANALSFALQVPLNRQPPGQSILPAYHQPPSITISKKRTL